MSDANINETYLIVITTEDFLRGKTVISTTRTIPIVVAPGTVAPLPIGKRDVLIPNSPVGKLRIDLE